MANKLLAYGNGCKLHSDCFSCPKQDCIADEHFYGIAPKLGGESVLKIRGRGRIPCKYCGSYDVSLYGSYRGEQYYWCKECKRKYTGKANLFHMKIPAKYVDLALSLRLGGYNYRNIRQYFANQLAYIPSVSTISRWIHRKNQKGTIPYHKAIDLFQILLYHLAARRE
jgi:transposase-like protein